MRNFYGKELTDALELDIKTWDESEHPKEDNGQFVAKSDSRFEVHPDEINKFLLKKGAKHSQEFFT